MQPSTGTAPTPSKRTVSLAVAIIMLVVGAGVGAGVTYAGLLGAGVISGGLCASGRTLTIGELLDLSGGLSSQGVRAKDSSALAISDINSFLSTSGCNLKFTNVVDDYGLVSQTALTDLTSFAAAGVQVVVGPLNSGAASTILQYADSNHIVLISPSSTSVALAIAGDYLFRTAPNDKWQGMADATMAYNRGARDLIIVQRHDTYGDALANATAANFQKVNGGHVEPTIQYPADPVADWTPTLNSLNSEFVTARATYPANQIGIDVIAFEEFGGMVLKAKSSYTAFPWSTLPWFGTDGEALDGVIVNATYGSAVSQVVLPSTVFGFLNNTKSIALYNAFKAKYAPEICDSYCAGTYDDVWLGALATLQAGAYDGTKIQAAMLRVAANYYGVTGSTLLEASGDRVATAYGIWKVVATPSGGSTWVASGFWDANTNTITYTNPP